MYGIGCGTTLRAKIEPDPRLPIYIQTTRDIGYRFETGPERPEAPGAECIARDLGALGYAGFHLLPPNASMRSLENRAQSLGNETAERECAACDLVRIKNKWRQLVRWQ